MSKKDDAGLNLLLFGVFLFCAITTASIKLYLQRGNLTWLYVGLFTSSILSLGFGGIWLISTTYFEFIMNHIVYLYFFFRNKEAADNLKTSSMKEGKFIDATPSGILLASIIPLILLIGILLLYLYQGMIIALIAALGGVFLLMILISRYINKHKIPEPKEETFEDSILRALKKE